MNKGANKSVLEKELHKKRLDGVHLMKKTFVFQPHHKVERHLLGERNYARHNICLFLNNNLKPRVRWMDAIMHWTGMTMNPAVKVIGNKRTVEEAHS